MKCPHCQGELAGDPQDPQKLLCYNCRKRYDVDTVNQYWASQQPQTAQPTPQPYQPAQAAQPYQAPVYPAAQPQYPGTQPQYPAAQPQYPGGQPYQQKPGKGMAIAALVLGIIAAITSVVPIFNVVSIVMGLIAVILGIVAALKAKKGTASGMGLGIAGLIFGVLAIVAAIVINVLAVGVVDKVIEEETGTNIQQLSNMNEEELSDWANRVSNELNENINGNFNISFNENNMSISGDLGYETFNEGAPAQGGWNAYELDVAGFHVVLGKTTLRELVNATPLAIEAGDENTSVDPTDTALAFLNSETFDEGFVSITVQNNGTAPVNILDCQIMGVDLTAYDVNEKSHYASGLLPGGLELGKSTVDDMIRVYGDKYSEKYTSPITDSESYNYHEPGNYFGITLRFDENKILYEFEYTKEYL